MIDWDLLHAIIKVLVLVVQMVGVPLFSLWAIYCWRKGRYQEATLAMAWAIFLKV